MSPIKNQNSGELLLKSTSSSTDPELALIENPFWNYQNRIFCQEISIFIEVDSSKFGEPQMSIVQNPRWKSQK